MTVPKIYLDDPNIGPAEIEAVKRVMMRGDISTRGPEIDEFEEKAKQYLGGKAECIAVNSGTSALFVSLLACGVGHGDEVIMPAISSAATANAIVMAGAIPVFVDINPFTWCIEDQKIEEAITEKTKAIIPVHLYGNPCDMRPIKYIAQKYKLKTIEDARDALGAYYGNKPCGIIGDLGCFSFSRNKIITTGGGGMVVTVDKEKASWIKKYVNQGRNEHGCFCISGNNLRMTNQAAAMGIEQLKKIGLFLKTKIDIYNVYLRLFGGKFMQKRLIGVNHSRWFSAIKLTTKDSIRVCVMLESKGIPWCPVFQPLPMLFPYRLNRNEDEDMKMFPNAFELMRHGICLPSSTLNSAEAIEYVAETIAEVLN